MKHTSTLMLIGALLLGGAGSALAGAAPGTVANMAPAAYHQQTIGEQLANGSLTEQQVNQLIEFTGLSFDKAKQYTVAQVSAMRWENN